ncbi:TPA: cell wall protein, partial [Enterococcus hirae]
MKFNKIKKKMTTLMLFLSLSGAISQPIGVLAETEMMEQSSEVKKESSGEMSETSSSNQVTNQKVNESKNDISEITESTQATEKTENTEGKTEKENSVKSEVPEVVTKEVPKGMEQYFFGLKDIQSANSFSKQEELAKNSQEWQSILNNERRLRSGMSLSENGRQYVNMTRITPTGTYYTHDYIVRWRLNGEDVFCLQEGAFTQAGISYNQQPLENIVTNANLRTRLSKIGYFGYYDNPTMNNYVFTQIMVWNVIGGSFVNYGNIGQSAYESFRNTVNTKISNFERKPSFHGKTYTVKLGEEIEIRDTSGAFSSWAGAIKANTANIQVRKSGNSLFIKATNYSKDGHVDLSCLPNGVRGVGSSFAYVNPNTQTLGKLYVPDPNFTTIN